MIRKSRHQELGWAQILLRLTGAGALVATGAIHLDLYLTGYRTIPTIGWLFLLQVISAFVIAVAAIALPLRLVSVAGAGFLLSTFVGYLISLRVSLFGFREVRTTAGIVAGVIEIVGFIALCGFAARPVPREGSRTRGRALPHQRLIVLIGRWVAGVITVQAAITFIVLLPDAAATATGSGSS